jgi:5-methylthioribose kinase
MGVLVQTEPHFDDEKFRAMVVEKDKEIEGLKSEKDSEIRALKNQLEVRNVVMFHTNFTGTLTCEFLCVICM